MSNVRVRFAPSPTGYLHIGGARTALFNWLYARHTGGKLVLRIEDTDTARNSQEAIDVIYKGLRWLGLDWDEGPVSSTDFKASKGDKGPYFQSQRSDLYRQHVELLLKKDMAYEKDGAIRFRMTREPILIPDLVVGDVSRALTDREEVEPDFVIVRSDGQPVFHLVNVIDDLLMNITHVIRGEDHLSNTAKHIALFRAFGAETPKYAHIPLILNTDGSKMSKRDTGASMQTYMDGFFMPEAVVNYLCLLGWSPKDDRQVMPIQEVIERFDLPQILRGNARFDMVKMQWMNAEYLKTAPATQWNALCRRELHRAGIETSAYSEEYITGALATYREKQQQLIETPLTANFYFSEDYAIDEEAALKQYVPENKPRVEKLRDALAALPTFNADAIQPVFKATATELGVKVGLLVGPVRVALTGSSVGPSLYHLMEVLGKERVLARIEKALSRISG
jgi:glutamyl-tRNA synthetase